MKVLRRVLDPRVLAVLGLLLLSALVWWVAPLLPWGEPRPLASLGWRVALLLLVWGAWLAHLAYAAWRRQRTNAALLQGLSGGPGAADQEARALGQRFEQALARLKAASGARWWGGGRHLYELPWYIFIGAPGSGKTTALMNAGLQFLLTDAAAGGARASLKGVGGTRHCEWWFTQDAVLIDTAGRYTTQESDREVDASAWNQFLALLKRTRPRQPINGVLLTVNVQDLLQQAAVERQEHAAQLRARLHELQARLGLRCPVYVLVTKADLIGGFNESFEALGEDERNQVWGFSFAPEQPPGADPMADFDAQAARLARRLVEQMLDRLEGERDVLRRGAIFGFAQEFGALQPVLGDFLRQVFSGGGSVQQAPWVRGVYFTSGTQEGTPIDRVMSAVGRSFGMPARQTAAVPGRGKSFFLHRLLKEVVFAERGLGVYDATAERRRLVLRTGALAGMAALAVAVVLGWAVSRARNLDHAAQVAARLPGLQQAVQSLPPATTADVAALPPVLGAVREAAQLEAFDLANPPLLHGLGLYQGDKLDAAARIAYQRLLQTTLMPRVALRLEELLRAAQRNDLENAYEALKAYLMLHQPERFDAGALAAWIRADWDTNPPAGAAPGSPARAQLDAHLQALLAAGAPRAARTFDATLVAGVRDMLAAFPLEYRIYSRVKRQYRPGDAAEFTAAAAAGPNGAQVFQRASAQPLSQGISGLYTRDGYRRLVAPAIAQATPELAREEDWVMGLRPDPARLLDATSGTQMSDRVRRLYFADYIRVWDAYLADVQLVPLNDPERALAVARLLSAPDSPLAGFLRGAAEQTQLLPLAAAPSLGERAAAQAGAQATQQSGAARVLGSGPLTATAGSEGPLERMVDAHFAGIHRLFAGEPPPINDTARLFGELYAELSAVDTAKRTGLPPPPGGGAQRVKVAAAQQPDAVRALVEQMADATLGQSRGAERAGLTAELKPITEICNRAITGRYPFASGARADVLPEDFGQVFGPGGLLDDFFQRRLLPLVDQSTNPWSYRPLADGTRPVSPAALAEFQRAQRIREVFFRGGGRTPTMRLELRLSEIEPSLRELQLDIDGQVQTLVTGGPSISVAWPGTRLASQVRLSTGLGAAGPLLMTEGPWALFRLFDRFQVEPGAGPERFSLLTNLDGRRVRLEVIAASVFNPFRLREIQQFRCPAAL